MSFKIAIILFLGVAQAVFAQVEPESTQKNTIFDIVDIIAVPRYPRLAHLSGQSGQFLATVKVGREGRGEVLAIDGKSKMIIESIRKALTSWTFLPQKEGERIVIQFEFTLLPSDTNSSMLITEIHPDTNKIIVKARQISLVRSSGY
jgi:hypothetical protein